MAGRLAGRCLPRAQLFRLGRTQLGVEVQRAPEVLVRLCLVRECAVRLGEAGVGPGLLVPAAALGGGGLRGGMIRQRLVGVTGGARGLAEPVERRGLAVPLAGQLEHAKRLAVVPGRLVRPAGPEVHAADVGQRPSLSRRVAELPVEGQCLAVVLHRSPEVAEPRLDVAEDLQRPGAPGRVAHMPEHRQRLPKLVAGLPVPALLAVDVAEVRQRPRLAHPVAELPQQDQRPAVVSGGGLVAAGQQVHRAEVAERPRLAGAVAGLPRHRERAREVAGGRVVLAELHADTAEPERGLRLAGPVAGPAGGVDGVRVQRLAVGVVAAVEIAEQDHRQPHRVRGEIPRRGVPGDHDQGRPLAVEPGPCGVRVAQVGNRRGRPPDAGSAVPLGRVQRVHRGGCAGDVVVEQPSQRRVALGVGVLGGGLLCRVGTQQVVHAVSAECDQVDQVRAGQQVERAAGRRQADAGQRSHGVRVGVLAGMQAEQAERLGSVCGQVADRPGEHRPYRRARVSAGVEEVQSLLGQFGDQPGQRRRGPGGGQLGGDPQRQRQPPALACEQVDRVRLGVRAGADQVAQQGDGVRGRQQVQLEPAGAVQGDQPGKAVPAGHEHHRGGRAGQQGAHLLHRGGVVEHDQHPPAGKLGAVPGGPLPQVHRNVLVGHAERDQESG